MRTTSSRRPNACMQTSGSWSPSSKLSVSAHWRTVLSIGKNDWTPARQVTSQLGNLMMYNRNVRLGVTLEDTWREQRAVHPYNLTTSHFSWKSSNIWKLESCWCRGFIQMLNKCKVVILIKVCRRWKDIDFSKRAGLPYCLLHSVLSQRSQSTDRWWSRPAVYQCQSQWLQESQPLLTNHQYRDHQRQQLSECTC